MKPKSKKRIKAYAVVGPKNAMDNLGGIWMWINSEKSDQLEIFPTLKDAEKTLIVWRQNVSEKAKIVPVLITISK